MLCLFFDRAEPDESGTSLGSWTNLVTPYSKTKQINLVLRNPILQIASLNKISALLDWLEYILIASFFDSQPVLLNLMCLFLLYAPASVEAKDMVCKV